MLTMDDRLLMQLKKDWRKADLDKADFQLLEYVEKLAQQPWDMEEEDVIKLREVGFSDAAILDINQVTGYYAFVNRLADGLGVELEPYWGSET